MLLTNIIKFLSTITIFFIFSSCDLLEDLNDPSHNFHMDKQFSSIEEANTWVHNNISYELNIDQYGKTQFWATPEQTLSSKLGDCKSHATLLMAIISSQFNVKTELVEEQYSNGVGHCYVKLNDSQYYDPTSGFSSDKYIPLNNWSVQDRVIQDYYIVMSYCYLQH